jgi:hypothetical protein
MRFAAFSALMLAFAAASAPIVALAGPRTEIMVANHRTADVTFSMYSESNASCGSSEIKLKAGYASTASCERINTHKSTSRMAMTLRVEQGRGNYVCLIEFRQESPTSPFTFTTQKGNCSGSGGGRSLEATVR